jgi:hypothetical protein
VNTTTRLSFQGLAQSVQIAANGREQRFSSRGDFIAYLVAEGHIADTAGLMARPDFVEQVYRKWQAQGQLACQFARHIGRDPEAFGIATKVFMTPADGALDDAARAGIQEAVEHARSMAHVQGLTLLFPAVADETALVRFCRELSLVPMLTVTARFNPSDRGGRMYVAIQAQVSDSAVAEILGFGPFGFLPFTRQSPITALELRTKQPGAKLSGPGKPKRLHLAAIPMPEDWTDDRIRRVWVHTERCREEFLGGDDSAAKAKVTFAIPQALWNAA